MEKFTLPVHQHPLHRVGCNDIRLSPETRPSCAGCWGEGHIDDGFRCSKCQGFYLHRMCGESALEISYPSHPDHLLKLLTATPTSFSSSNVKRCGLCGVRLYYMYYHCSICDFTIDTGCAINGPPLPIIEKPKAHEHTLRLMMSLSTDTDDITTCNVCGRKSVYGKYVYECSLCELFFHIDCASLSPEIKHPCHPRHSLKFVQSGSSSTMSNRLCILCDRKHENYYHCSICDFTLDVRCAKNPPALTLMSPKTHDHQLTLMPRLMSFTCNACGMKGDKSPYVCVQCNFVIHVDCVDLPRVIHINRHDHPVSHTYNLDRLAMNLSVECGICHKTMDSSYGAYSCLKCETYAVHPRCATYLYIWEGVDIEGEPEIIEDVAPFKVKGNNLIEHFSHVGHDMILLTNTGSHEGTKDCNSCVKPIDAIARYYKCIQCDYILDEACANLPRKIRTLVFSAKPTLVGGASYSNIPFLCSLCGLYSSGFKYKFEHFEFDLQCILTPERQEREDHHHPLFFFVDVESPKNCSSCCRKATGRFDCVKDGCDFSLCLLCAQLPEKVKHKSDDHTLRLCGYGREIRNEENYWCDICEKRVDQSKQYYTCDDCGTTLHIKCVLGDLFGNISRGGSLTVRSTHFLVWGYGYANHYGEYEFEVIPNNGVNRPLCCICFSRCTFSLVLKTHDNLNRYVCSRKCVFKFLSSLKAESSSQSSVLITQ